MNAFLLIKPHESVPGTNQYWAMRVKVPAHGNKESLTGFELTSDRHPLCFKTCKQLSHATSHFQFWLSKFLLISLWYLF